jgi:hypothetical protein
VTFLKNASDLWVYPDCRGFHSKFITGSVQMKSTRATTRARILSA